MADPNNSSAPVGSDAGTLSDLQTDIGAIEQRFEPRIEEEEHAAERYEQGAVEQQGLAASEAESAAADVPAQQREMQEWADATPSRQGAYASTMHAAPFLSVLMALGGKVTKLNGQQMLAAQTGMIQGLNEASEQKYTAAYNAWQASYKKMRDHQADLMKAHSLMLTAYQGRADAYQKAAEAARRMTGDLLDDKQRQVSQRIDTFKAQSAAMDKLERVKVAQETLHERVRHDLAEEAKWKDALAKSSNLPSDIKMQIAAEQARWGNAKAQRDELLKRRGQINSNLTLSEDIKKQMLDHLDVEDQALSMEMDKAVSNRDAIVAGYHEGHPAVATKPAAAAGGSARAGVIDRGGSNPGPAVPQPAAKQNLSPARMQLLEQHKGQPVQWADGTWIMEADGNVHQVQ